MENTIVKRALALGTAVALGVSLAAPFLEAQVPIPREPTPTATASPTATPLILEGEKLVTPVSSLILPTKPQLDILTSKGQSYSTVVDEMEKVCHVATFNNGNLAVFERCQSPRRAQLNRWSTVTSDTLNAAVSTSPRHRPVRSTFQ